MKKIIILLLTLLMSACSAVKTSETLSSMQTETTISETTVAETATLEETTKPTQKATETVIEVPKEKPTSKTTTATITEAPVERVKTETIAVPPTMPETPVETVKEEEPTEIPKFVEMMSESITEPPRAEFDVNYWIDFARSYAFQIGLEIDETAVDCWDNPITANADCIYLERDLKSRLNRYVSDEDITAVNIWAESLGNGNYLIYIAYA